MTNILTSRGLLAAALSVLLTEPALAQDGFPKLPDDIASQGVLRVGVKCDYPPDGYLDMAGEHIGIEVEMARQIAEYAFSDSQSVEFSCVTSSNRVPALVGDKVDLLIATMGVTKERAEVVTFTNPYAWGASSIIVPATSDIQSLEDLKNGKIGFVKGSWQIPWFEENMPDAEDMRLDTVSDVLQAMMQNRVDAYAHDIAVQMALVEQNDQLRMLDDRYKIGTRAAAVRKGDDDWAAYLNAALDKMADDNLFEEWIREYDDPNLIEAKLRLWDVSQMPENSD